MYRRFEPVASPQVVVADTAAITGPGSTLQRLVIRSDNRHIADDPLPADTGAASRHLLPPRTSVEMAERMGVFDDANGKLLADPGTWKLIALRDGDPPPTPSDPLDTLPRAGELPRVVVKVAGEDKVFPRITQDFLADLPYLPDAWARGVALRDLPGTPGGSLARIDATTPSGPVAFDLLDDPNPRSGSALLVSFGQGDWQTMQGIRLALAEPAGVASRLPDWNAATRTLTVYLAKGERKLTPVSCYLLPGDLPKMGIWQWLQEEIALRQHTEAFPQALDPARPVDELAQILQRTVEGGHWMLSPPVLLELVHALRQPLGLPAFQPLAVGRRSLFRNLSSAAADPLPLQTALTTAALRHGDPEIAARRDPDELAALTGWRALASTEAYLLGALRVHGVSTGQVELLAEWSDPVDSDDPLTGKGTGTSRATRQSRVDRIDLSSLKEGYLRAADAAPPDPDKLPIQQGGNTSLRRVGYYDPEHDQIAFVKAGDASLPSETPLEFIDAAPRHVIGDTRHHRIRYRAVAVSRDADCFASPDTFNADGTRLSRAPEDDFARTSEGVEVSIPASARPLAPEVAYVLPSFGWQRQTDTEVKRSVRFGGGLRVYLKRPWFSSGEGELLGVALWHPDHQNRPLNQASRDRFKSYFTQWGMDPIWRTEARGGAPDTASFPDRYAEARSVSLDEIPDFAVDVVGYPVVFDPERQLWYADLTLDASRTYAPFVRLALVRYQPDALPDARLSRVVLADFAQLTAGRAVVVHPDPARARVLRIQLSGVAPRGPTARVAGTDNPPTRFRVRVQERVAGLPEELGWRDAPQQTADAEAFLRCQIDGEGPIKLLEGSISTSANELALWEGSLCFPEPPEAGRYRLLIEEFEVISNDAAPDADNRSAPERLVFAETVSLGVG
jgi:hypothetical protein